MSDSSRPYGTDPPPAPPLPPSRLGPLQRFIAPLGLSRVTGRQEPQRTQPDRPTPPAVTRRSYGSLPSQTAAHRTGIPVAALDINQQGTHAILAGKEILRTVRVNNGKVTEDFNLRTSITSYESTHGSGQGDTATNRREYLPARDVRWSINRFDHIIATAAVNGRISLYDVNAAGSRIELARLHEHAGQVNKLDFDPFGGYWLLSASQDKTVKLWDIRDPKGTRAKQRFDVRSAVREVKWSPKEGNDFDFAVCADGGVIQNWDARNPLGPKLSINAHDRGCYSLDWHPDGRHVVSGGFDKYVRVWDFKSDSRRQKPTFQFRAPQAIRIVRWRPPTGYLVTSQTSMQQTTQIATTYNFEDPRIHVWDFRRPFLPFRELDTYNTPASDFLWASQDLLWTVGDQGMFTQNDVTAAPQVHNSLPPCAIDWMPDGRCAMFSEERIGRRESDSLDPMSPFLSIPRDRLSGDDGDFVGPHDFDTDEVTGESLLSTSFGRRQGRASSSKSGLSHNNSPPVPEIPIQQLDQTILATKDVLQNHQTGAIGVVEGASSDIEVVKFLANRYASPASEKERRNSPEMILQRLEDAFKNNAEVCDDAALHRMAQSWRVLSAVIIPELQDWADGNRAARQAAALERKAKQSAINDTTATSTPSVFAKISSNDFQTKPEPKNMKIISNLFRALKESGRSANFSSTSNMTTPLARPVSDSTRRATHTHEPASLEDSKAEMEGLEALPPSLLHSHSTASAAAHALLPDGADLNAEAVQSPPDQHLHSSTTSNQLKPENRNLKAISRDALEIPEHSPGRPISDVLAMRPRRVIHRHEDQRAALRDYRGQSRPVFRLDNMANSPNYDARGRNDSAESFPMFPASTSSSHREVGMSHHVGISPLSPKTNAASIASGGLESIADSDPRSQYSKHDDEYSPLAFYGSKDFSSGMDGSVDFHDDLVVQAEQTRGEVSSLPQSGSNQPTLSSSPEMFEFDHSGSPPQARIHLVNPITEAASRQGTKSNVASNPHAEDNVEVMANTNYILADFRPIDLSTCYPRLPFAWSALPLVCQIIAFDLQNGIASAQFAAHLLLHISPYFFAQQSKDPQLTSKSPPASIAERLMIPDLSRRIIEGVLVPHTTFLRKMQLYESLAIVRKLCADLGYDRVADFGMTQQKEPGASKKDPYVVSSVCHHCKGALENGRDSCTRCFRSRPPCPICLQIRVVGDEESTSTALRPPQLWMVCQSCGHGAHTSCMQEWLSQVFAEGCCPTTGCECDCAPGSVRQARLQRQIKDQEEASLIRGSAVPSAKKDPHRASHSPAVDKTRAALRAASDERGTQSSDERRLPAKKPRQNVGGGGGGGLASSRKSVRLVTPGEERTSPRS